MDRISLTDIYNDYTEYGVFKQRGPEFFRRILTASAPGKRKKSLAIPDKMA
jgi:hypothetical protein